MPLLSFPLQQNDNVLSFRRINMIIIHLICLEYEFKRTNINKNTTCTPREEKEFTELGDAKIKCKNTRNCKGVLQPDRKTQQPTIYVMMPQDLSQIR